MFDARAMMQLGRKGVNTLRCFDVCGQFVWNYIYCILLGVGFTFQRLRRRVEVNPWECNSLGNAICLEGGQK